MSAKDYLKRGYARRLSPNPDGGYTAMIQEFPGLIAEGESADEAVRNLEAAAEEWIEATLRTGHEIPDPIDLGDYSGKIALRLPRGLHQRAAEMANSEGVSLNQWLVSAIAFYLGVREALRVTVDAILSRGTPWVSVFTNNIVSFNWTTNAYTAPNEEPHFYVNVGAGTPSVPTLSAGALSWQKPLNTYFPTKN